LFHDFFYLFIINTFIVNKQNYEEEVFYDLPIVYNLDNSTCLIKLSMCTRL